MIVYVTSTPYQLAPFLLKFLRESKFPEGPVLCGGSVTADSGTSGERFTAS